MCACLWRFIHHIVPMVWLQNDVHETTATGKCLQHLDLRCKQFHHIISKHFSFISLHESFTSTFPALASLEIRVNCGCVKFVLLLVTCTLSNYCRYKCIKCTTASSLYMQWCINHKARCYEMHCGGWKVHTRN